MGSDALILSTGEHRAGAGLANGVQQGGLAVVNVTEDTDHRRPRDQLALGLLFLFDLGGFRLGAFTAVTDLKGETVVFLQPLSDILLDGGIHGRRRRVRDRFRQSCFHQSL